MPFGHMQKQRSLRPINIERDSSQNDRYRDYSPGDVVIKTPSIPFAMLHYKQPQSMFDQPEGRKKVSLTPNL